MAIQWRQVPEPEIVTRALAIADNMREHKPREVRAAGWVLAHWNLSLLERREAKMHDELAKLQADRAAILAWMQEIRDAKP